MMSDWSYLASFGIKFQREEEAKENERSQSVALLQAGPLERGIMCELERMLYECDDFFSAAFQ